MRNTAFAGQVVGWLAIIGGAIVVLIGLVSDQTDIAWQMRSTVRAGIIGQGLSSVAAGVAFLLLAGILETLLDLRDDARAGQVQASAALRAQPRPAPAATTAAPARYIHPPVAPNRIGDPPRIAVPSRYDMMMRYGETDGAAAWELLSTAAKAGIAMPEADAVRKVREKPQHG